MDKKRKAIITGFLIFLVLMGVCSLVTKGIYRAGLPQVTTVHAREMSLYHPVSATGSVAAGQEYGIYAPAGLLVATVAVQKGDSFQAGELLLQLDVEDLKKILAAKELERQRLICQQREVESQNIRASQNGARTLARAQEEYEIARRDGELQVSRAREELVRAQEALEQVKKQLEQEKKQLEQAKAERKQGGKPGSCGEGNTDYRGTVSAGDHDEGADPGDTLSEADAQKEIQQLEEEVRQLEKEVRQLQQAVRTAEQAVEDALLAQTDGLRSAQRSVDDARAAAEGGYGAAEDLARLEQAYLEEEIRKLQELLEAEGWICAREGGRITELCVSTGQRTPDTAQLLYTPDDGKRLLQAEIPGEQAEYVSIGTRMQLDYETVSGGKQSGEGIVNYLETLADGRIKIWLDVTQQGLSPGQQVTLSGNWQSESYGLVVPVSVLQQDNQNRYFLYILRQQNGILGTEWHASRLYVNVLDQSSSYAAIESAALSADTDIILTSSAEIRDNAVVRVVE